MAQRDGRAARKRYARKRRPRRTPGRAETIVCWTACEPRIVNRTVNASGRARGRRAPRSQMRRIVVRAFGEREVGPGGPYEVRALSVTDGTAPACVAGRENTAMNVSADARPL